MTNTQDSNLSQPSNSHKSRIQRPQSSPPPTTQTILALATLTPGKFTRKILQNTSPQAPVSDRRRRRRGWPATEMVKFSKDLEAQLIPEWKEAFVDYWLLKKHVKRIKFALLAASPPTASAHSCSFFHFLLLRLRSHPHPSSHLLKGDGVQKREGDEEALNGSDLSDLCSPRDEIGEFLERLNGELNKVNEFYKVKEGEFLERGQALDGQLQILLQLKQFLVDRRRDNAVPLLTPETASSSPPPSTSFSVTDPDPGELYRFSYTL